MCTTALFMGCSAPDLEQQVDELYGKMTQEERIAQLRSMYMEDLFDEQGKMSSTDTQRYWAFRPICFSEAKRS